MKITNFRDFLKHYNLKNNTMNTSDLQRVSNYPIYPRDSKICSDKRLVNIDNGSLGGTPWVCLIVKDKSFYFDSFGGQPDKNLLKQIPKPKIYRNYKIQDINLKLCGSFCLYFFSFFM